MQPNYGGGSLSDVWHTNPPYTPRRGGSVLQEKNKRPPDYYNLFIIGIIWLAVGLPFQNYALAGLGLAFMLAGLAHKKDWEKNRVRWSDLTPEEKKLRMAVTVALGILVLLGLVA
ncbi:MAG: hypothetical protein ACP5E4_00580 [Candidatus Aenigmatarchaeota archaeon]